MNINQSQNVALLDVCFLCRGEKPILTVLLIHEAQNTY